MQSVAAVYNRIEREALRHDREPLYAWLSRRTDNAVKEAIKHGMRMANEPDYRLGVEAGRFARDYADAFEGFIGTGEKGQRFRGLLEGALRLRAGGDTVSGATATRREVERLLGVMRAEIESARAPVSGARSFPVRGFAASTLDAEADLLRDDPTAAPLDEDDVNVRAVVRAYEQGGRKALAVTPDTAFAVADGLNTLANTEDAIAERERAQPVSKRDPERARMARAASEGLTGLRGRVLDAFKDEIAAHYRRALGPGGVGARGVEARHPAYRGHETMDYEWWLQHYAPPEVREEVYAQRRGSTKYVDTRTPEEKRQDRAEAARMGRKLRAARE